MVKMVGGQKDNKKMHPLLEMHKLLIFLYLIIFVLYWEFQIFNFFNFVF